MMILAIDPGKDKCGLAVLETDGKVIKKEVVPTPQFSLHITHYTLQLDIQTIVVGNGTYSKAIDEQIKRLNLSIKTTIIPEEFSSLEARKLYWQDHRPRGFMRLIPTSLRVPPVPIDDYAAIVLGQRFLTDKNI